MTSTSTNISTSTCHSAVVIGAGLAGLTAAYRLKQAGWQVHVYECADYPGGRVATVRKDGYVMDVGATGVGDFYSDYMELLDELGLSKEIVYASPITATLRDGKLYEINANRPLLSGLMSGLLSLRSKFLMTRLQADLKSMGDKMNFQDVSLGHEYDIESAEQYALRRTNQELLDYFINPMLRAMVMARPSQVSRLELMNAMNGLFNTKLLGTRGGLALLPETLAERIGNVRYNTEVSSVTSNDQGVEVTGIDNNTGQAFSQQANACVIATTLPEAVAMHPACQPQVKPLQNLHYVPGVCVHLGYSVKTKSKAVMALLSSVENPRITVIWLDHNKVANCAPAGHSLIYLYYDDAVAEQAWNTDDQALVKECSTFLEQVFPELNGALDMSYVSRWSKAVPLASPGVYRKIRQVRCNLDENSNNKVQLAGDYLSCVGQNTAIHYGTKAAKNLINNSNNLEAYP